MNCRPCIDCIHYKEETRNILGKPHRKHSITFIKTDKRFKFLIRLTRKKVVLKNNTDK